MPKPRQPESPLVQSAATDGAPSYIAPDELHDADPVQEEKRERRAKNGTNVDAERSGTDSPRI